MLKKKITKIFLIVAAVCSIAASFFFKAQPQQTTPTAPSEWVSPHNTKPNSIYKPGGSGNWKDPWFHPEKETTPPVDENDAADELGIALGEIKVPRYKDSPYYVINDNTPFFAESEITTDAFEDFKPLDDLGRCGVAYVNVCKELMPTEEREDIGSVTPSGWEQNSYDFVDGKYLYNRCHLIGHQLTGENANELNLITGTRYMNVTGMLPFENLIDDYVDETGNHVLYRVTPVYEGNNLVTSGVLMEAWSVEDNGEGICFCVFCYNVQPGVTIDYATGKNWESKAENGKTGAKADYILNIKSMKIHTPDCSSVNGIAEANKEKYTGDRETLEEQGYTPCSRCNP